MILTVSLFKIEVLYDAIIPGREMVFIPDLSVPGYWNGIFCAQRKGGKGE
jgi:hypothetical protein